jgi:hypothetical protein
MKFQMTQLLDATHSYARSLIAFFDRHGTWWQDSIETPPLDLCSGFNMFDFLWELNGKSSMGYGWTEISTITMLAEFASARVQNKSVFVSAAACSIHAPFNSLPDELWGQRFFLMDEKLAEVVIYGGNLNGQAFGGWRGIETLNLETAEALCGHSVVGREAEDICCVSKDLADAVELREAWDDEREIGRPHAFGFLPPGFWCQERHNRITFQTYLGKRPWACTPLLQPSIISWAS